jgi:dCTP deaminase
VILSDFDLRSYIQSKRLVIEPFADEIIRENGLDLRLGDEVCELKSHSEPLDPTDPETDLSRYYECKKAEEFVIEPYKKYLLTTLEYVKLPPELMGFVELRSTFARLGLSIPPTIIDAGFCGQITIELHGSAFPVMLKKGMRFLHVVFAKASTPITKPYSGRYQGQRGVKLPKLPV